jgi:probable F420-dependent oxidoreductase
LKIGCFIPQIGEAASPESIVSVAQKAERLGFDSAWVTERLLYPVNPRNPYAAEPDGKLPEGYRRVLDPLDSLTWAAAHTKKIRLGTSVIDMPFYTPVVLGRRLTTLDVLSGGRLNVGLGLGWSDDEFEAAGTTHHQRGAKADEFLGVLHNMWKDNPASFDGRFYKLPASYFDLKPVQKPHPPIYMAAYAPQALSRVARLADYYHPVGLPFDAAKAMFGTIQRIAGEHGRKADDVKLSIRGNLHLTKDAAGEGRWPFHGNKDEVKEDIAKARELDPAELVIDVTFSPGVKSAKDFEQANETVRELLG